MTTALSVNGLDFDEIKTNLTAYLKSQTVNGTPVYQDYDFTASAISTLLNILAYNTHYLSWYMKMVLNESFLDSIVRRESAFSKAKLTGYIPGSRRASRIDISLSVNVPIASQPSSRSILIPKGTSFVSSNVSSDQRVFYTIQDLFMKTITSVDSNTVNYTCDPFTIYEGSFKQWSFLVDNTILNQRFIIQDANIDINTLRVLVIPFGDSTGDNYALCSNAIDIQNDSQVYYLSTNEDGYYEIFFGNDVFGKEPDNQSKITAYYMSTNGDSGNGAKRFRLNKPTDIPNEFNITNWSGMQVIVPTGEMSNGGAEVESLDSMRFSIPHNFKRQNRIVTKDDYRFLLLSKYQNIESVNVWGGEEGYYRDYGKVHICIKPFYADKLTESAKRDIKDNILMQYCAVGMEPLFVDPEFINVSVSLYAKVDTTRTVLSLGEIERQINDIITEYNTTTLNVFDNSLSDVTMLELIMDAVPSIKSCYTKKTFTKDYTVIYSAGVENIVLLGNPIESGVTTNTFTYGVNQCYYKDDSDGKLYIYNTATNAKLLTTSFGYVEYDTGVIHFTFPTYATMIDTNFGTSGVITFSATPANPDIETYLNSIIRITTIRVYLSTVK